MNVDVFDRERAWLESRRHADSSIDYSRRFESGERELTLLNSGCIVLLFSQVDIADNRAEIKLAHTPRVPLITKREMYIFAWSLMDRGG